MVVLTGDTGESLSASSGDSTLGGIMTTTETPETSEPGSGTSEGSESDGSTTGGSDGCGDGSLQEVQGEECDYGAENSDDAECTSECRLAKCGDGKLFVGAETCDDGVNDGSYGGCSPDCKSFGPFCGDGNVDGVEECDAADPKTGCLRTCTMAASCKEILEGYPGDPKVVDGVYAIQRAEKEPFKVYCEMDADGGGYTFLKYAVGMDKPKLSSKQAEAACDEYDMDLLITRSQAHVHAALEVAQSLALVPVGGGVEKNKLEYLSILGIYPVVAGLSCENQPLTTNGCPEWKAKTGKYYVTEETTPGQPGDDNCMGCSMLYKWDPVKKDVSNLEVFTNADDIGPEVRWFMCDVGDKLP